MWTCVDVSVCVLVPQLGSGKGAEPGCEGQEGLGACLVLRERLGPEGIVGRADQHPVHQVWGGPPKWAGGERRTGEQGPRQSGRHYFLPLHSSFGIPL